MKKDGEKEVNVGLELLRVFLTLGVVLNHFWIRDDPGGLGGGERMIWHWRTLAVPAFMTMTFLFTAKHFIATDTGWVKRRFVRLYEPFVFWAIVYWMVRTALSAFNPDYSTSLSDLGWQLLLGSSRTLTMQFWFHADLIILTLMVFSAFKIVKFAKAGVFLSFAFIVAGFAVQYSPLNALLFADLPFEVKYPLGRVFCMLPYAGCGFLFAAAKPRIDSSPPAVKSAFAAGGAALAAFVVYAPVDLDPPEIVGYEGLSMVLTALGLVAAFYCIPRGRLPAFVRTAVLATSRYSMGIYCVHLLLGQLFYDYVLSAAKVQTAYGPMRVLSFGGCVAVWLLSYAFCRLFAALPFGFCTRAVR